MIQGFGVSKVLIGCGVVVCGGDLFVVLTTAPVVDFDIFCLHFDDLRIPSKLQQQNSLNRLIMPKMYARNCRT